GDVPLRKAEYGVLSLPTMIGEDPYPYSIAKSDANFMLFLFHWLKKRLKHKTAINYVYFH
ncbi:hypothetical protein, partial [Klebsiella pneumoniae]|uniref:hypothetical protein n=1 Tax=Klebsiella pneumoniae TaxID=573 RepID=UPI001CA30538